MVVARSYEKSSAQSKIILMIPKIISADDHVIEPASVWQDRVPLKHKEKANLIIKKYEKKLNVHYLKRWKCKKCESVNPSTFDICWKCNS